MELKCKKCKSIKLVKAGFKKLKDSKVQKYKCKDCGAFFTGCEKYKRLTYNQKINILDTFKEGMSLNATAKKYDVNLNTVQYLVNIVRKSKPENERKYQERMKNRKRSKAEQLCIQKHYMSE